MKKNGKHAKFDNLKCEHIYKHNRKFMTSLKIKLNSHNPSMTKFNIYHNITLYL